MAVAMTMAVGLQDVDRLQDAPLLRAQGREDQTTSVLSTQQRDLRTHAHVKIRVQTMSNTTANLTYLSLFIMHRV